MNKNKLITIIFLSQVYIFGCDYPDPSEKSKSAQYLPFEVEGLIVPGTKDDAIKSGFTECKESYPGFECKRKSEKPFFGVTPIQSKIYLNEENNLLIDKLSSSLSNENKGTFTFRTVEIEFPENIYDKKCLTNTHTEEFSYNKPEKCINNRGIHFFRHALEQSGWLKESSRGWDYYIKENTPIKISFNRNHGTSVSIYPETLANISNSIRYINEQAVDREKQENRSKEFIDSMTR